MSTNFTGPGKVTIELTNPPKKGLPLWRILIRFIVFGMLILTAIHLMNLLVYYLG